MAKVVSDIAIQIAKLIVRSNVECYNQMCEDDDVKSSAHDFKNYGVDEETAKTIINHHMSDILVEVNRLQSQVAEVLYD